MAETLSEEFKNWLETRKGKNHKEIAELAKDTSTSDYKNLKKEFDDLLKFFEEVNSAGKDKGINLDYAHYSSDKINDAARDKYDRLAADIASKTTPEERKEAIDAAVEKLSSNVFEGKGEKGGDEDTSWIEKKKKSWNNDWCVAKHSEHPYVFDPISQETDLKFNIYKDEAKTQLGATIHYTSPTDVTMETEEGKTPDFEFFDKMVHEAVAEDGVLSVNFVDAEHMTDDFKAKLAIACINRGVAMEGFDGNVDLKMYLTEEEFKKLPAKTQKEIEYRDIKNAVKLCKTNGDTVKISPEQKDKSTVAMLYAAAKEVGAKVEGFDAFTKDSHGMFILPAKEKEVLPKEVQAAVNKFNNDVKEKNIEDIKAKVKINTDPGNASVIAKFNEFDDARNLMNLMMKTDAGKSLRANLDRENHDRDLALAGKPAKFNVSVKDEDVIAFLESLKDKDHKFSEETLETLFPDKKKRGEFLKNTKHPEEQAKLFKERYIEASDVVKNDAKFIKNTKDHHSAYNLARNKLLGHSL